MQSHPLASFLWRMTQQYDETYFQFETFCFRIILGYPNLFNKTLNIFLYYCMNFHLKPIFPGAISADIISVDGAMICKIFKGTRVWLLFVMGTFFGIGFLPSQGNERNLSFLGGTLFSNDASRTMSAGCGWEKWPKFVHFWRCSRTSWAAHIVAHLLAAHDQWPWVCSYVPPDLKEGRSRLLHQLHDSDPGVVHVQLWKSAKMRDKWTHQCSSGNQCSFRGCELGEWLVIVVLK